MPLRQQQERKEGGPKSEQGEGRIGGGPGAAGLGNVPRDGSKRLARVGEKLILTTSVC